MYSPYCPYVYGAWAVEKQGKIKKIHTNLMLFWCNKHIFSYLTLTLVSQCRFSCYDRHVGAIVWRTWCGCVVWFCKI